MRGAKAEEEWASWPEWQRRLREALRSTPCDEGWLAPAPPLENELRRAALGSWLGRRMWWCRDERAGWSNIAVVSSRVGRPRRSLAPWLLALTAACRELDGSTERLITSCGTTTHAWLERCHDRWRIPLLQLELPRGACSLRQWARRVAKARRPEGNVESDVDCWFASPAWEPSGGEEGPGTASLRSTGPLRDRVTLLCADRIRVLALRPGGNLWRLLETLRQQQLQHAGFWNADAVEYFAEPAFVPDAAARVLRQWGARPWRPALEPAGEQAPVPFVERPAAKECSGAAAHWAALPEEGWLTHCTRAPQGPWPGQSQEEYLDDWLSHPATADYTPLAALERIVRQQRLWASRRAIRGGTAVVSFTEVPPAQLAGMRTYRQHRLRWDFEPFAVCVRREWLVERGGRPVRYGDDALYRELPAGQRPYFQSRITRRGRNGVEIDWSLEREWRHVGDLPLHDLPPDAGRVLVPDRESAGRLAEVSPWPIAILPVEKTPD